MDVSALVEPDRVHKTVYTDQQIFDREMERIWERIWVYCGHESQVPNPGDYYAVTIGRQPMIMVRQKDGSVQVLYNRCPHRGVQVVGNQKGNTGSAFVCSYHAWSFHLDGSVRAIPLAKGYEGTRMTRDNPDCGMKRAARVAAECLAQRGGFLLVQLAQDGAVLLAHQASGDQRRAGVEHHVAFAGWLELVHDVDVALQGHWQGRSVEQALHAVGMLLCLQCLLAAQVVKAARGMRIDVAERRRLGLQGIEHADERGVLEHVGEVAGMEGMAIVHGRAYHCRP
jgi:nitrite reductase/ring-hydroxylating ferredoxin subunit